MKRLVMMSLLLVALVVPVADAFAEDAQPIAFFYPLRTRRPVIERELELRAEHEKSREGRTTTVAGAVEIPILPRWQVEIEVPLIVADPKDGPLVAGVGDIEVETKVLVWQSLERVAALAIGIEGRFPSGSERRGLGGEAAVEPFATFGIALGDFDVLTSLAYEVNVNGGVKGPNENELSGSAALAWRVHRAFAPFVEIATVTRTRGDDDDGLLKKTQVYVVPGFNLRLFPRTTLRLGVELPLTHARTHDYAILSGFVKEF
jgi:Putative MetA-pathway of phenol degradation